MKTKAQKICETIEFFHFKESQDQNTQLIRALVKSSCDTMLEYSSYDEYYFNDGSIVKHSDSGFTWMKRA